MQGPRNLSPTSTSTSTRTTHREGPQMIYWLGRGYRPHHRRYRTIFRLATLLEFKAVDGGDDVDSWKIGCHSTCSSFPYLEYRALSCCCRTRAFQSPPGLHRSPMVQRFAFPAVPFCRKTPRVLLIYMDPSPTFIIDGRRLSLQVTRACGFTTAHWPMTALLLFRTWVPATQLFVLPSVVPTACPSG